jgi:hypothetical protein
MSIWIIKQCSFVRKQKSVNTLFSSRRNGKSTLLKTNLMISMKITCSAFKIHMHWRVYKPCGPYQERDEHERTLVVAAARAAECSFLLNSFNLSSSCRCASVRLSKSSTSVSFSFSSLVSSSRSLVRHLYSKWNEF